MGLLGKIAPEHRQLDADNIDKSLVAVKNAGDSLRTLATSVEHSAARLGQLSSMILVSNSISQALFQAIRNDQLFYSQLKPVIDSVQTDQRRVAGLRNQHGLDKSKRENQNSGAVLAETSLHISRNVRSTLENCLGKKAELEGTAIAPLKEKVYEAFSSLNLPESVPITSVPALMQLQDTVEQQVQIFSWQFEQNLKEGKPISSNIDLGGNLIASHTESQAEKVDALRSSLIEIKKCIDSASGISERSKSRVLDLDLRLNQLEKLGKGFDSSQKVLEGAFKEEESLVITAEKQLAILVNRKNQVEAMLAEQRLPKELRTDKTLNGTKRMKLAAEAAQHANDSNMIAIRASNSVRRSQDGLVKAIETELKRLDAPITARAVDETGTLLPRRGHYARFSTPQELSARNALENQVRQNLKALQ